MKAFQYNKFNFANSISGYGFGIRFNINNLGNLDFCIGLNKYGDKIFNFIMDI